MYFNLNIYVLHDQIFYIFLLIFTKNTFLGKICQHCVSTIGVPVKICSSDLVTVFKKYLFFLKVSVEPTKNVQSMPQNSYLGQLRPKWIYEWILCSRICPFEFIFHPLREKNQTQQVFFSKIKKEELFDQEKVELILV